MKKLAAVCLLMIMALMAASCNSNGAVKNDASKEESIVASAESKETVNSDESREEHKEEYKIREPGQKMRYELVDSHLHYLDFLEKSDGFTKLVEAMDMSGVKSAIIFGMPMAKQWDETMAKAPTYYLSNDSRCYYYSGTDFILA